MKTSEYNPSKIMLIVMLFMIASKLDGQVNAPARAPRIISSEVHSDRTVTFRISAPLATKVIFVSSDINNKEMGDKGPMKLGENGVWETTVGPLDPGAYRYNFNVDGLSVVDPLSSAVSESNTHVCSIMLVLVQNIWTQRMCPAVRWQLLLTFQNPLVDFVECIFIRPPDTKIIW
jgi:hypothetical protein